MKLNSALQSQVALGRDLSIASAAAATLVHQVVVGNWFAALLAVVAASTAIWTRRRAVATSVAPVAVLLLTLLLVWGFQERLVWLTFSGGFFLVCWADLDRLVRRFPVDSSPADQRWVVRRHGTHLLVVVGAGALTGVVIVSATLQLQLAALLLLAVFAVVTLSRVMQSVSSPADSEESSAADRQTPPRP